MQHPDWNDLRYLLALGRYRSLSAAGRRLGVDATTVSRRLAALQDALGARLAERAADGGWRLTPAGEAAFARAEAMEREVIGLDGEIGAGDAEIDGGVRLTAVPILVNRLLAPAAGSLLAAHPALRLELVGDPRDFSLTRREADMALRLARPVQGGGRLKARRIATLAYAAYAPRSASDAGGLAWVGYDETMAHLPQAQWMARSGGLSGLRVADAEAACEAVAAGQGRTLLPRVVADADPRLRRLDLPADAGLPDRELWLLVHADLAGHGRIRTVTGWIEGLFG